MFLNTLRKATPYVHVSVFKMQKKTLITFFSLIKLFLNFSQLLTQALGALEYIYSWKIKVQFRSYCLVKFGLFEKLPI